VSDDFAYMGIRELGARLRRRQMSIEEVVRAAIARTERLEPQLNSYITLTAERAVDAARSADVELRSGRDRGPLHGVPISVKDHIDTAGIPTTAGTKVLRSRVPAVDAPVVRMLKDAGAVLMGKANLNRFAGGESGWNPDYGKIHNPWHLDSSPGGSSGGSGVQVAAGLVSASIGSDNGGSVRIPAALCGVVGFKATFGRVPMDGVTPRSYSTDHVGPLARTVEDTALVLQAISGQAAGSTTTHFKDVPNYLPGRRDDLAGLRIGVDRQYCQLADPSVGRAFASAITTFERLGCSIRDIAMPDFAEVLQVGDVIFQPEIGLWYEQFLKEHGPELPASEQLGRWMGMLVTAYDYLRANQRRAEMQHAFAAAIDEVDVVASPSYFLARRPFPTSSDQAVGGYPALGTYHPAATDGFKYTLPFNFLGLPAISVPCAVDSAGAVGLQLAGRAWEEVLLLRVAGAYERAAEWTHPPQPFS
jgi:aspartyl-tRNA(Asn)/glutamyl-tRNA(Gln) amidotransferase subunit A